MDQNTNYKILVVDDEEDIVEFISYNLKKEGFNVDIARNGVDAVKHAKEFQPDLILLDIMMPEMDGIETCEKIRTIPSLSGTIIAFLTARAEDFSQIAGFSAGADDYITKPIRPKVLVSRIMALLKRSGHNQPLTEKNSGHRFDNGSLVIDKERHLILLNGNAIDVPKKEFSLLLLLSSKPSRLFSREEIFDHLWGSEVVVSDRTIDVYIRKLREKIGEQRIKTVKGMGYKFEP
ncbi:MAG: response regulator transcription factor [Bacteroidales bacterium]|nr:response regulator transcription factor [Bacteroidales bacterium]MCB8998971.1 response regulator transcription factor [Bacteroidales bacterium]MCB9013742.1 response regulator transcription factor [Bacteroidales bacterium]